MTRSVATILSLLLATGLAMLPGPGCRKGQGRARPPVPITIACPRTVSSGLAIIANQKGYLARGGAQITFLPFESGKAALGRMLEGGADLAMVAETPIAQALLANAQLKVLAAIHQSNHDLAIVARKDRGITFPSDLKGKGIGYSKGTSGHFFLDTYLLVNRIPTGGIRFVDLPPLQLRTALLEGRVDAVSTWEPHVAFLVNALGPQGVALRDEFIYAQTFFLVARPDFIRDHPEQVKPILEGLCSALDLISRSPVEAGDLLATYTQVDPTLISTAFSARDFDVSLDQSHILSLEIECRWLVDSGAVPRRDLPDVLAAFHLPGLLAVRPRAVQIIHEDKEGGQ
jgi:ABC-type nitrate/sulfonate/bicarbonate transport system substrate-binding protein